MWPLAWAGCCKALSPITSRKADVSLLLGLGRQEEGRLGTAGHQAAERAWNYSQDAAQRDD